MKCRVVPGVFDEEIQKVPLGHKGDKLAFCRQMREVGDDHRYVPYLSAELAQFLMRALKKVAEDSQFVHQFQCGWMNRVAAKVSEKICMLFENENLHARARQQKAQHHCRR